MISAQSLLIVDCDRDLCDVKCRYFLDLGYSVTAVHHPRMALEAATFRTFDAMILAYDLPEVDGLALARRLQRLLGKLPIIILDGSHRGSDAPRDDTEFRYMLRNSSLDHLQSTLKLAIQERHLVTESDQTTTAVLNR